MLLFKPNFSAKMSDVGEHSDSEFYFPKKKKKKENRFGHMIKCLLTELGQDGREIFGPRSVRHDLGLHIFPSGPPTQSIGTCYHMTRTAPRALSLQNYRENPRMRAVSDGASRARKSRPALLGLRTALLGSRMALRELRTNFVAI